MQTISAFVALAPAIGCGGNGGDAGYVSVDDFWRELSRATCERFLACGQELDRAACEANLCASSRSFANEVAPLVQRGTVSYDGTAAARSFHRLGEGCDWIPNTSDLPPVLTPKVAAGGACTSALECVAGVCDTGMCGSGQSCAGTCVALPSVGQTCASSFPRCAPGTYCRTGTCAAQAEAGASCDAMDGCQLPSVCRLPTGATTGICGDPAATGETCGGAVGVFCAKIHDYCDDATSTCTRKHLPGEDCTTSNGCVDYAFCNSGTCRARYQAGEACDAVNAPTYCGSGLVCEGGTNGVCAARTCDP
jgi:hypothetical protein